MLNEPRFVGRARAGWDPSPMAAARRLRRRKLHGSCPSAEGPGAPLAARAQEDPWQGTHKTQKQRYDVRAVRKRPLVVARRWAQGSQRRGELSARGGRRWRRRCRRSRDSSSAGAGASQRHCPGLLLRHVMLPGSSVHCTPPLAATYTRSDVSCARLLSGSSPPLPQRLLPTPNGVRL